MWFILQARLKETRERNEKSIPFYWFQPIAAADLEKCKFANKKT